MLKTLQHSTYLVFALSAVTAAGQPAKSDPPLELIERVRIAFYERAPAEIAGSMRAAVQRLCGPESKQGGAHTGPEWLCDGRHLNFLRSVDVLGNRQKTGFVCNDQGITSNMKYFLDDMFADNPNCVFVAFNVKTNQHFIDTAPID